MPVSTLSSKGQVTLPIAFRRKLGIKPRDRVVIELEERAILVKPAPNFFALEGFLGKAFHKKWKNGACGRPWLRMSGDPDGEDRLR